MTRQLTLGYSPCPNDTYIFYALTHGLVNRPGFSIRERLEDVETLNQLALDGLLDLTKISYHALGHLRDNYALLHSGGALGRGCGPLVIAAEPTDMDALRGRRIAIPGRGEADAGLIIHESRFTYRQSGFSEILDLGAWWEELTGLPIPLGGILARRDLGTETIRTVDAAIHASLEYARMHPEEPREYIKVHAQELDDAVIDAHIGLYVNDFSLDLGDAGVAAIETLFARAEARGLIPKTECSLFVD
jgi:1,4-dihydroxy-6-naphthoate synthase